MIATNRPVALRATKGQRRLAMCALAISLLAGTGSAMAEQHMASGADARSASASVDFRIVIPETLRMVEAREQRDPTRQFTSRTTEHADGREIITLARP